MKTNQAAGSLKAIFHGFRRISQHEQTEYLKYLELVILRNPNDKSLIGFKRKLQNYVNENQKEASVW